jgi:putative phosphoribosyl transferase
MSPMQFADRSAAGRALGARLAGRLADADPVILGLPRGGVVVAARVAEAVAAPLGVIVARKVRCPGTPELAMGAVAVWGDEVAAVRVSHVIAGAGVDESAFARACEIELAAAREGTARWQTEPPPVAGRAVVVVDDGLATGATMRAALAALRMAGAGRLVAAVPVGARPELLDIEAEVVCLLAPDRFGSVGAHYEDFGQVDDATVAAELARPRGT